MDLSSQTLAESKIFVIDDNIANTVFVERLLRWAGFQHIRTVSDSRLALAEFVEFQPDIDLLDLHMPHVDGFEILADIRSVEGDANFLPVLIFTGDPGGGAKSRALTLGASDFLTKPGDPEEILQRVRNFLRARLAYVEVRNQNQTLEDRVHERTAELEDARQELFDQLVLVSEYRDKETGDHTQRVGALSSDIASAYGLATDECALIKQASELHDIGKIGIPDSVLLKPGRFDPEEFEIMKRHTEIGARILETSKTPVLQMAKVIARSHHENWDGTGYSQGLKGENIPLCARIVSVADVFDALTTVRPYKEAWTVERAIDEIIRQSGSKFDPEVVDSLLACRSI